MRSSPRQPRLDEPFEKQAKHYCELLEEVRVSPDAITIPGKPELGFMSVMVDDYGRLWVEQLYGDVKFWGQFAISMAKRLNTKIYFSTKRRTRAYERLFGAKEVATIMEVDPYGGLSQERETWAEWEQGSGNPSAEDSEVKVRPAPRKTSPDRSSEAPEPPSLRLVEAVDN